MIVWHKIKIYHFDPYNVLLAIATNIPMLLITGFVLQGHICNIRKGNNYCILGIRRKGRSIFF